MSGIAPGTRQQPWLAWVKHRRAWVYDSGEPGSVEVRITEDGLVRITEDDATRITEGVA